VRPIPTKEVFLRKSTVIISRMEKSAAMFLYNLVFDV
jgi:hypothetical protein